MQVLKGKADGETFVSDLLTLYKHRTEDTQTLEPDYTKHVPDFEDI